MPRTLSITSLTTACLAAACFAPPTLAQGVFKPLETLVVNPASRPVPVTVLSTPAQPGEGSRQIYRLAVPLTFDADSGECSGPQTVPAGKRIVLQHMSASGFGRSSGALTHFVIRSRADTVVDLVLPAPRPVLVDGDANFTSAGQQVNVYFDEAFEVCAFANVSMNGRAHVSLHGYLVNRP